MPEYRYLAINTEGREIRGSTSATSMEALLSGLERDNLELIEVDTKSRGVSGDMVQDVTGREKVSRRELADLFFPAFGAVAVRGDTSEGVGFGGG